MPAVGRCTAMTVRPAPASAMLDAQWCGVSALLIRRAERGMIIGWYGLLGRLCGGGGVRESHATRVTLDAPPHAVWNQIMFYEEVPGRPALLLRILLPRPVRTGGDKRAGALVRCVYTAGELAKRITTVEPPHVLEFDVVEQRLGIESCVRARGGSYRIASDGDVTDLVLLTRYDAYLRPRSLWRPLEALLVRQLHRHILGGIRAALRVTRAARSAAAESATP
jgi:hypothetical protein